MPLPVYTFASSSSPQIATSGTSLIQSLLSGEINTLGYPDAALFSLSCAYLAYDILQCIRQTLEHSHPDQTTEISLYYLADEISHTMRGLDSLVSSSEWAYFQDLSPRELAMSLRALALPVPYRKSPKRSRGKKPPPGPREVPKREGHASTAKLLDQKHDKSS